MSFAAMLAREDAYYTLADAQISAKKAANTEGFASGHSEAKYIVRSGKLCGLVTSMDESIWRKVTVFTAQVLIFLFAHGASTYGRAVKNSAKHRGKIRRAQI